MKMPSKVGEWVMMTVDEYLEYLAELEKSRAEYPRRTCPGGYDYAEHDCMCNPEESQ